MSQIAFDDRHDPLEPVPAGVLVPEPSPSPNSETWCGVGVRNLARLIANYTEPGDVVCDLEASPAVAVAARRMWRHPVHLVDGEAGGEAGRGFGADRFARRALLLGRRVALMMVADRWLGDDLDPGRLSRLFRGWRGVLRPGGFLLAVVSPSGPAEARGVVVAAARAAGLVYQQHLIVLRGSPPEWQERAEVGEVAARPGLVGGRHDRAHLDLVALATTATGEGDGRGR